MNLFRIATVYALLTAGFVGSYRGTTSLQILQQSDADRQVAQERTQAELDAPKLAKVLALEPGMTVADIGAGGGAMSIVLAKLVGAGRVFATDLTERSLTTIRDYAKRERLDNITVIEGAAAATNLPESCCDALFLRNVYHHVTDVAAFNRSLYASLKPGGRLAIIDFVPSPKSELPKGVPENREGHGIPMRVVSDEMTAAGFVHVETIQGWPLDGKSPSAFLVLLTKPR